jgi:hypothetical protein
MVRSVMVSMAVLLSTASLHAQPVPELNGEWVARFKAPNGQDREAKLTVDGATAVWQVHFSAAGNPCLGRPTPASVSKADATSVDVMLFASKALAGCVDSKMRLVQIDADTYEAILDGGRKATFKRR